MSEKLTILALAVQKKQSLKDVATGSGISYGHLAQVSAGNVKMTADDLERLSHYFGVPMSEIEINYAKKSNSELA